MLLPGAKPRPAVSPSRKITGDPDPYAVTDGKGNYLSREKQAELIDELVRAGIIKHGAITRWKVVTVKDGDIQYKILEKHAGAIEEGPNPDGTAGRQVPAGPETEGLIVFGGYRVPRRVGYGNAPPPRAAETPAAGDAPHSPAAGSPHPGTSAHGNGNDDFVPPVPAPIAPWPRSPRPPVPGGEDAAGIPVWVYGADGRWRLFYLGGAAPKPGTLVEPPAQPGASREHEAGQKPALTGPGQPAAPVPGLPRSWVVVGKGGAVKGWVGGDFGPQEFNPYSPDGVSMPPTKVLVDGDGNVIVIPGGKPIGKIRPAPPMPPPTMPPFTPPGEEWKGKPVIGRGGRVTGWVTLDPRRPQYVPNDPDFPQPPPPIPVTVDPDGTVRTGPTGRKLGKVEIPQQAAGTPGLSRNGRVLLAAALTRAVAATVAVVVLQARPPVVTLQLPTPVLPVLTPTPPAPSAPPASSPTPLPVAPAVTANLSFQHTSPGVYSTVFLDLKGQPGSAVRATLSGAAVDDPAVKTGIIGDSGVFRMTWTVRQLGAYTLEGTAGQQPFSGKVNVLG